MLVCLLCCFSYQRALAQDELSGPGAHTLLATQLCKEKDFDGAITEIELAVSDSIDSYNFFTWYSRGFIYKELYKERESDLPESRFRELSVASFIKSRALAGSVSEQTDNHDLALKYLANTYYNDALRSTLSVDNNNDSLGHHLMETYCSVMHEIQMDKECPRAMSAYYNALGQRFHDLWTTDEQNKYNWDQSVANYRSSLELNPGDCSTSYNLLVLHCNLLVSHRNKSTVVSPEDVQDILRNAASICAVCEQNCREDVSFSEQVKRAQSLLTELRTELAPSAQPSKN